MKDIKIKDLKVGMKVKLKSLEEAISIKQNNTGGIPIDIVITDQMIKCFGKVHEIKGFGTIHPIIFISNEFTGVHIKWIEEIVEK